MEYLWLTQSCVYGGGLAYAIALSMGRPEQLCAVSSSTSHELLGLHLGNQLITGLLEMKSTDKQCCASCLQVPTESCQHSCPGPAFCLQGQRTLRRGSNHSLERPKLASSGCGFSSSPSSERRCHSKALCGRAVQLWS